MARKILEKIPNRVLKKDLQKYQRLALAFGATDARIITTNEIVVDERVRAKCIYPKCIRYGTNANCPPFAMHLDQVREVVNNFKYAIFLKLHVLSKEETGPEAKDRRLFIRGMAKIFEIVSKVEAEAFYDGYYLALGFASGSCKGVFCPHDECTALIAGQSCRYPLKSRSSMEGVGIDAFTMAAKIGWDIYPIGASLSPDQVPHGTKLGIVLIY